MRLSGATVKCVLNSGQTLTTMTDAHGYYFFEAVPPGTYAVGPVLQGWLFNVAVANVSATNNFFVFNFAGTRLDAATGGAGSSKVKLSLPPPAAVGKALCYNSVAVSIAKLRGMRRAIRSKLMAAS